MLTCPRCLLLVALATIAGACSSSPEEDADLAQGPDRMQALDADMAAIAKACRSFSIKNRGRLPDELEILVKPDAYGNTYLDDRTAMPLDPWGRSYGYELLEPTRARLTCLGADGAPGGEGADADVSTDLVAVAGR